MYLADGSNTSSPPPPWVAEIATYKAAPTAPTITPSTANLARNAATLLINGSNFDTNPANDSVSFTTLGAAGTVTAATATQLTVSFTTPPTGTGALDATVTTTQGTSTAAQVATIVPAPTVTTTTTNRAINAPNSLTLTISGTNFDTTAANNTVAFDLGAAGTVTAATATQLTVTFTTAPTSTGALHATVTTDGGASNTAQVATIVAAPTVTANTANLASDAPTLVITGTGFDPTAANDSVALSSGAGTVTSVNAGGTQLTVTFNLDNNAPTLTITGTGFDTTAANNTVAFSSGTGTVTAATATQLTVTFTSAPSLGNLTATVTSFGGASNRAQVATIIQGPGLGSLSPTQGTVGQSYSGTITVSGGTAPYSNLVATGLPPGLSAALSGGTVTISGTPTAPGTYSRVQVSVTSSTGGTATGTFTITINPATPPTPPNPPTPPTPPTPPVTAAPIFAVGAGEGAGPQVNVYDARTGAVKASFYAWPASFAGGVRVAVGDVTGDGVPDVIVGAGVGGLPEVKVFDGVTFQLVRDFFAFPRYFTGGVFVAAGDVNADGFADVVVGAGAGAGPQVNIYSGKDGSVLSQFYAFPTFFTGGVRVAAGDVTGAGHADIVAAAGPGGSPEVQVFDGIGRALLRDFFAFAPAFSSGSFVAAGDVNGDGKADIIAGMGAVGGPQVLVYDGGDPSKLLANFFALPQSFLGGVRVGYSAGFGSGGKPAVLTAAGPGGGPQVSAFDAGSPAALNSFFAMPPGFGGGLFVGS